MKGHGVFESACGSRRACSRAGAGLVSAAQPVGSPSALETLKPTLEARMPPTSERSCLYRGATSE
eukprot:scaffold121796_cov24-Prasinocladus_malaysianus.AAC.1